MKQLTVTFRDAGPEDADRLRLWDTFPHVKASDPESEWEWSTDLAVRHSWREQWIAMYQNHPFGFLQIINPQLEPTNYWEIKEPGYCAIDLWIGPPEYLNRGFGTQMMNHALAFCFDQPAIHTVLIDPLVSNTSAIRFYKRLGFKFIEERYFDSDHCYVMALRKQVNE